MKYLKTGGHASRRTLANWQRYVVSFVLWWIMPSVILFVTASIIRLRS